MEELEKYLTPEKVTQLVEFGAKVFTCLVLLVLAFVIGRWVERSTQRFLEKTKVDATLSRFFANLARWSIIAIAAIFILGVLGVQTASFAAVLASLSFAVGLALQGSLSNFASGVMLLIFRPFSAGDFIKAAGESGTVNHIDLLTTTLDTPDNRRIIIPNSQVFGSTIENVTFHAIRRLDIDVGTAYEADLSKTREVLEAVVKSCEVSVSEKDHIVYLKALGTSSIDWQLRIWVKKEDYWPERERLMRKIKVALDETAIGIPFPQMDVHLIK